MFRIRHKVTGRFVKKASGSMRYTAHLLNKNELGLATTYGMGHSYNTRGGAEKFISNLVPPIAAQFEVVEFGESR